MQAVLQALGVAVLALERGTDGRVRLAGANDPACRLLGLNLAAACGRPVAGALPPALAAEVERAVARCLDGPGHAAHEHDMALPDGRRLRISHRPVAGEAGGGRCVLATITAAGQDEPGACGDACRHLHRLEVLSRLASGCGHALNNHLQPILTFSRHMQEDTPPEARRRYLDFIHAAAMQIRGVMETAQAIARPGRGAGHDPAAVPVADLIDDAARAARLILPPQVAVRAEADSPGGQVVACRAELAQALLALMLEAADSIGGTGEVRVRAGRANARAGMTDIAITATGGPAPDEPEQTTQTGQMPAPVRHAVLQEMLTRWGGGLAVSIHAPGMVRIRISLPEAVESAVSAG